ncbi:MAG: DMT family transporter [Pseudobutyrivibrio sp.]|mgnify:FL=1|nr:DMT family transporter [Pseudobutyrivibrio sp.]
MWMLLVLSYGIIKGIREICKKKALDKYSVIEVLTVYTVLSTLLLLPTIPDVGGLGTNQYLGIAFKSFVLFIGWIMGFKAIKHLPISMYGVLDLSRVLFATFLAITVLHEEPTVTKTLGTVFVCAGLLFLKFNPSAIKDSAARTNTLTDISIAKGSTAWYVALALISCVLNAVSGLLDKILMGTMTSTQLQFWYTLFLSIYYCLYVLITRTRISKAVWKNGWVWLLAILLLVMDKALFIANADPDSQVTIMTLIKQSGVIVTILAGKLIFKEKDIIHKLICAAIIIVGIILGVL